MCAGRLADSGRTSDKESSEDIRPVLSWLLELRFVVALPTPSRENSA